MSHPAANRTRKMANKGFGNGNQFCSLPDKVMMMRGEGHTPYSLLPTTLRLSHLGSHARSPFRQFTNM